MLRQVEIPIEPGNKVYIYERRVCGDHTLYDTRAVMLDGYVYNRDNKIIPYLESFGEIQPICADGIFETNDQCYEAIRADAKTRGSVLIRVVKDGSVSYIVCDKSYNVNTIGYKRVYFYIVDIFNVEERKVI